LVIPRDGSARRAPYRRRMATRTTEASRQADARERLLDGLDVVERRLRPAGVSTAVLEAGDGPPVLLLHGAGGDATHWLRVLSELARTHRVIAPDLPGHGASEPAERALEWLGELIESSCEGRPALVGHALGGAIAARFAAAHGERLDRLVLVDALGLAAYNVDRARTRAVQAAPHGLMAEFGMTAIPPEELDRIDVRTTLIWGRHDLATPLRISEAASERHGWSLRVIEQAGDDPATEQPETFVRALRGALADAEALVAAGFRGTIVDPRHPRYDELRRVFNGMVDRRPALIARCTDARDVAAAVDFARDRRLPVSVYAGGHNVTGNAVCDDGVTIDLRPMKDIAIDPAARTCRAAAGLTWGELDAATQRHGLAVTGGRMSTTGIGGLIVGGGSGWIERKFGYAVDNLLSVELVLADGRIVTASESEHPELFWGTRGGGGNLGVATS
jgi:pimeloyl-ACP methyl ester carboxylesterase